MLYNISKSSNIVCDTHINLFVLLLRGNLSTIHIKMKLYRKSFWPKKSFVKSIPGSRACQTIRKTARCRRSGTNVKDFGFILPKNGGKMAIFAQKWRENGDICPKNGRKMSILAPKMEKKMSIFAPKMEEQMSVLGCLEVSSPHCSICVVRSNPARVLDYCKKLTIMIQNASVLKY
jgi:hypothetical protein